MEKKIKPKLPPMAREVPEIDDSGEQFEATFEALLEKNLKELGWELDVLRDDFDWDEFWREERQKANECLGLYCYYEEGSKSFWSLWRESDDMQLTPWIDLGPDGMIWVLHDWKGADKTQQFLLILERRDDAASPPILRQALMHLPSGQQTDFVFAGERGSETTFDIDRVNVAPDGPQLLLTWPHDAEEREDVHGAALYVFDGQFRELIGPCISSIHPAGNRHQYLMLQLRHADQSLTWGVFDYRAAAYVISAEYENLFERRDKWFCQRQDGGTNVYGPVGVLLARHDHVLSDSCEKDRLYAIRDGLWGWADNDGNITVAPYATDISTLNAEPLRFSRLTLKTPAESPLYLNADTLAMLDETVGDEGTCIKYEGVPLESHGDGYLDISSTELPEGEPAFLLEDRGDDWRFLVLRQPWRKLPTGSVLALRGKTRLQTVAEGSDEALFLDVVLGIALDFYRA
ncbi:hypothetical protein [Azonexus sp.]|jgi:hypothetical protein|uniref:hypothetical protein n=1 Tax=Azonexus sp. TaxID=1872668 RepID=UPI0028337A25|nr:hypothetical protein [Azonexus sp.]MDR1995539.1 hypothetical protein [Azonexus sp.]